MNSKDKKAVAEESEKLVTAPARTLESKESLASPNPYTTDWTDMSELTRKQLSHRS